MATQIKNIPLKGLATSPSDFTCEDGVSAMALNMLRKDGSFVGAIHSAPVLIEDTDGANIIYQHINGSYKHLIYKGTDGRYYWKKNSPDELGKKIGPGEGEINPTSVGHKVHSVEVYCEIRVNESISGDAKTVQNGGQYNGTMTETLNFLPVLTAYIDRKKTALSYTVTNRYCSNPSSDNPTIVTIPSEYNGQRVFPANYGYGCYWWEYSFVINGTNCRLTVGMAYNRHVEHPVWAEDADDNHLCHISSVTFDGLDKAQVTFLGDYFDPNDHGNDKHVTDTVSFTSEGTKDAEVVIDNVTYKFGRIHFEGAPTSYSYPGNIEIEEDDVMSEYTTDIVASRYFQQMQGKEVHRTVSVKNILIFYADKTYYYLYTEEDAVRYRFLGSDIPQLNVQFSLDGHFWSNHVSGGDSQFFDLKNDGDVDVFQEDALQQRYCSKILGLKDIDDDAEKYSAAVNAIVGEANLFTTASARKGYFSQPFLVRYALRMYDGSITKVSAPILMLPSNHHNPVIFVRSHTKVGADGYMRDENAYIAAQGLVGKLLYSIDAAETGFFNDWKDIVTGVVFYVSRPIYTYNQDTSKMPKFLSRPFFRSSTTGYTKWPSELERESVLQIGNGSPKEYSTYLAALEDIAKSVTGKTLDEIRAEHGCYYEGAVNKVTDPTYKGYWHSNGGLNVDISVAMIANDYPTELAVSMGLDYRSDKDIRDDIASCGDFYKIAELEFHELESGADGVEIPIKEGTLIDVATNEALSEDYDSWHEITPRIATVYNSRLHIGGITKRFFVGFAPDTLLQRASGQNTSYYVAAVHISDNTNDSVRCIKSLTPMAVSRRINYIYYPDPSAKEIDLYYSVSGVVKCQHFMLSVHPTLNGACYVADNISVTVNDINRDIHEIPTTFTSVDEVLTIDESNASEYPNEVRSSEVFNPFVYRASNVETVGDGELYALVPASVALSEGQFGQHPMFAMTGTGIWALSVNQTGGFSAVQPISRDVLLGGKPTNILQLDQQILFCSERGLMSITGSSVECISDRFDGDPDKFRLRLAGEWHDAHAWIMDNVASGEKVSALELYITDEREDTGGTTEKRLLLDTPFKEVIKDAVLLYDYRHSRVIVGWRDKPLAYVLDLKDGEWTTIVQRITSAINSYPDCYAMTSVLRDDGEHFWTDTKCVDFSAESADEHFGFDSDVYMPFPGLYMTRTLSLGDSTSLKVIRTLNVQGRFANSHVGIILLGSNDNAMNDWVVLASVVGGRMAFRNGTPMKHFRLLIPCHLAKGEDVSSVTVEFEVKEPQNKLRQ